MKAYGITYDRKGYCLQQSQPRERVLQGDRDENAYTLEDRGRILNRKWKSPLKICFTVQEGETCLNLGLFTSVWLCYPVRYQICIWYLLLVPFLYTKDRRPSQDSCPEPGCELWIVRKIFPASSWILSSLDRAILDPNNPIITSNCLQFMQPSACLDDFSKFCLYSFVSQCNG